jgi:hypothetical protein
MSLPFTVEQFLGVFARYNEAIWPLQVVAYLLGVAAVVLAWRRTRTADRLVAIILTLLWTINGAVYHVAFFHEINPIAVAFGALFLLEAALFLWFGAVRGDLRFTPESGTNAAVGWVLVAYAMVVYPLLNLVFGHIYPEAPVFGVAPCPTVIFTFGLLVWVGARLHRWMLVIPIAWALLGLSAATQLGIREDLGLTAAALVAAAMLLPPHHETGGARLRPGHVA